MSLYDEDGNLSPDDDAALLRLIQVFKVHFGRHYALAVPSDFEWTVDRKIGNDALHLLMLHKEPEDFLGLFENADAERMDTVIEAVCNLDDAIAKLSVRAREHLVEEEKMALSAVRPRTDRTTLNRAALLGLADIVMKAKKYIAASEKRGRSDKKWNAIAVANDCIKIWERQTGERPYLSEKVPEKSGIGKFVIDIFAALEIDVSVPKLFAKLNAKDAPDLSGVPSYLRRPRS